MAAETRPHLVFHPYTRAERAVDTVVHVAGLAFAVVAVPVLIAIGVGTDAPPLAVAIVVYGLALLAMLGFSALYNIAPPSHAKALLRKLDHSAIFVMIAGTYTPLSLYLIGGDGGTALFVALWVLAGLGIYLSLAHPGLGRRLDVPLGLAMGWSILLLIRPLIAATPARVLALLLGGGALYTAGVGFHLARRLRFHNAIWHVFVLAAAICHYVAILEVAQEASA